MLAHIKNFIKTKPVIYDILNAMRPIKDDTAVWLDEFSKSNNRKVNFIQVGASDGLRWDPLRRFILRDNWSGVLVEPLSAVYDMLKYNYSYVKKRNLIFLNYAISSSGGFVDFWSCSSSFLNSLKLEDRLYYLRKSSLDKSQMERCVCGINWVGQKIECKSTPCITLCSVIEKYFFNNSVDLVFIDAEGRDDEVIRTINFDKCLPKAIFFESHNLGKRYEKVKAYLSSKGYRITQFKGDAVAEIGKAS